MTLALLFEPGRLKIKVNVNIVKSDIIDSKISWSTLCAESPAHSTKTWMPNV
mgnify:CR=1